MCSRGLRSRVRGAQGDDGSFWRLHPPAEEMESEHGPLRAGWHWQPQAALLSLASVACRVCWGEALPMGAQSDPCLPFAAAHAQLRGPAGGSFLIPHLFQC